jgi:hypothetical protein
MKRCWRCSDRDVTVSTRERMPRDLRVLCAACYVDVRSSSVRQVAVPEREQHDRYAQMAERYGVK